MLTIGMIDDEQASLEIAKGAFQAFFKSASQDADIRGFTKADIFLDSMKDTQYDLICSDIIMEPMNGIELAKKIRAIDKNVSLIFISSNETKVFACFDYNPIGFIRKTNFFQDTQSVMKHYLEDVLPSKTTIRNLEVKSHGETMLLNLDNIIYIEGNHNYQSFHMKDQDEPVEVRKLISDLEKDLTQYGFLRVHKGFLVNYRYIFKFAQSYLTLKDGTEIPLSRQNREEIVKKYMELTKDTLI